MPWFPLPFYLKEPPVSSPVPNANALKALCHYYTTFRLSCLWILPAQF
nr:MAG TPA: hypothetical protein [Caudoviricetes sp.]